MFQSNFFPLKPPKYIGLFITELNENGKLLWVNDIVWAAKKPVGSLSSSIL